jgi:hypothetical protein
MATPSKTSFASTYSQKLASIFSRNSASSNYTARSFPFLRLPYDIRIIIYSYLETKPLLAPRTHSLGLYQACRHIKTELDELDHKLLESLCTRIEKTSCFDVTIKLDSNSLRHITLTLPYTVLDTTEVAFHKPKWRRYIVVALNPLFALRLDTLHIHFTSDKCSESSVPKHDTLEARLHLQDTMRSLISDIGSMIMYKNYYLLQQDTIKYQRELDGIFTFDAMEDCTPFPSHVVRAKRICLSWDLRSLPTHQTDLVGKLHHVTEVTTRTARFRPKKISKAMISRPGDRTLVSGYYLRDAEHLVGEVGIVSSSSWDLNGALWLHLPHLVRNGAQEAHIISSKGLGSEYKRGLGGVGKKEFEEVERAVEEEREKMREERMIRQHDELVRAYIEEGIMID